MLEDAYGPPKGMLDVMMDWRHFPDVDVTISTQPSLDGVMVVVTDKKTDEHRTRLVKDSSDAEFIARQWATEFHQKHLMNEE